MTIEGAKGSFYQVCPLRCCLHGAPYMALLHQCLPACVSISRSVAYVLLSVGALRIYAMYASTWDMYASTWHIATYMPCMRAHGSIRHIYAMYGSIRHIYAMYATTRDTATYLHVAQGVGLHMRACTHMQLLTPMLARTRFLTHAHLMHARLCCTHVYPKCASTLDM